MVWQYYPSVCAPKDPGSALQLVPIFFLFSRRTFRRANLPWMSGYLVLYHILPRTIHIHATTCPEQQHADELIANKIDDRSSDTNPGFRRMCSQERRMKKDREASTGAVATRAVY